MIPANDHVPIGHPRYVPQAWPALLSKDQLCAYIGISEGTLMKVCPVRPLDLGANVVRYSREQVDAWVATLPPRMIRCALSSEKLERLNESAAETANDCGEVRTVSALDRVRARARKGQR